MKFAEVIISITHRSVDRIFSYIVPEELNDILCVGMRVLIPFGKGNKTYEGYVIGFSDSTDVPFDKLKSIISVMDKYPMFSENTIMLAKFMKEKYYTTLSECLQCIMPSVAKDKTQRFVYLNRKKEDFDELFEKCVAKNNLQSKVLNFLLEFDGASINEIKMLLEINSSPVSALEKKGLVQIYDREIKREVLDFSYVKKSNPFIPTDEQKYAIDFIKQRFYSKDKKPILIHGVTGSGKTEIYLQIIAEVLKNGKQAIVLVPEISLTPQTVNRFMSRFGKKVSVTHSRLSVGERFDQWKKAREGEISIMIGPRSAVFTPFSNLGIIIIDEEHEHTYKSETTPKYDAREIACEIGRICGSLTVLGSATPDISTYYKTQTGEFELVSIKNRVNNSFPEVNVIDMRHELESGNKSIFSNALLNAVEDNLLNGRQTILFLNRRGYSTFVSCRKCGYVMECKDCNVNYTYHLSQDKLICHYCGKTVQNPKTCPQCGSQYIKYFGAGTQKIEEETKKMFPEARVLRMDMDTTSGKHGHENILKKFASGEADILIGTQMIAKGLDFPNVSVVGVIAADMSLNSGDFKCAENTFQMLTQVSGRAGRASIKGKVFIQTYNPEHYSIEFAKSNDYEAFYNHEIMVRNQMNYPPFTNIFFIMFTSPDEKKVIKALFKLLDIMIKFNKNNQFEHIGPSPAVVSKIKNQYRWKLIVKGKLERNLKNYVLYCLDRLRECDDLGNINVNITLNPVYIM